MAKKEIKEEPKKDDEKVHIKAAEAEEEVEKEEDLESDEEEDEEEKKKKKTKKGEAGGENPAEGASSGTDANSSVSPGMGVPSTQNVAHGSSGISVGREASSGSSAGLSPSDVHYMGKSVNADLTKSPLFVELTKQMDSLSKAVASKLESVEKSVADRLANLQKAVAAVESFYNGPFYKANAESTPAHIQQQVPVSLKDKVRTGEARFSY